MRCLLRSRVDSAAAWHVLGRMPRKCSDAHAQHAQGGVPHASLNLGLGEIQTGDPKRKCFKGEAAAFASRGQAPGAALRCQRSFGGSAALLPFELLILSAVSTAATATGTLSRRSKSLWSPKPTPRSLNW